MNITSWLQYDFMRNALIAVLIITPLFGIMGTMIVNKRWHTFQMHSDIQHLQESLSEWYAAWQTPRLPW